MEVNVEIFLISIKFFFLVIANKGRIKISDKLVSCVDLIKYLLFSKYLFYNI